MFAKSVVCETLFNDRGVQKWATRLRNWEYLLPLSPLRQNRRRAEWVETVASVSMQEATQERFADIFEIKKMLCLHRKKS